MAIPHVSVVMPNYNGGKYIGQAIESVLAQTYADFELIVVDDASTDESKAIIAGYKDSRIQLINMSRNSGNAQARNAGIRLARGTYLAVHDADDLSMANRFEEQIRVISKTPEINCVSSQAQMIDSENRLLGEIKNPTADRLAFRTFLLLYNFAVHSSIFIRRSFLNRHNIRYRENLTYAVDYQFMVDIARHGYVHTINKNLVAYRKHDSSLTQRNRVDQNTVADIIRISQLALIDISLNETEQDIYLKCVLNREKLSTLERDIFISIALRIRQKNTVKNYFDQWTLMSILDYSMAVNFDMYRGTFNDYIKTYTK